MHQIVFVSWKLRNTYARWNLEVMSRDNFGENEIILEKWK